MTKRDRQTSQWDRPPVRWRQFARLLLLAMLLAVGTGTAWGQDAKKTATLNFSYSGGVGADGLSFYVGGNYSPMAFTLTLAGESNIAEKYESTGTYSVSSHTGVTVNSLTGVLTIAADAAAGSVDVTLTVQPKSDYTSSYNAATKAITLQIVKGFTWSTATNVAAGGQLAIPVKAGMVVTLTGSVDGGTTEMRISGATRLDGSAVSSFMVGTEAGSYQFLASTDGSVIVSNPSTGRTLALTSYSTAYDIVLRDGNGAGDVIYIEKGTASYTNAIINAAGSTFSYTVTTDASGIATVNATTGEVTLTDGYGTVTMTVTGTGGPLNGKTKTFTLQTVMLDVLGSSPLPLTLSGGSVTGSHQDDLKQNVAVYSATADPMVNDVTLQGQVEFSLQNCSKGSTTASVTKSGGNYELQANGLGTLTVRATLGKIEKDIVFEVSGVEFDVMRPVIASDATTYTFTPVVPAEATVNDVTGVTITRYGDIADGITTNVTTVVDKKQIEISNISGSGAFSVTATVNYTPSGGDATDATVTTMVTKADATHEWDFATGNTTDKLDEWSTSWTLDSDVYSYNNAVHGDNAKVMTATAGLLIDAEPADKELAVAKDGESNTKNLLLRQGARLTIPLLRKGQWIALHCSHTADDQGERLNVSNVLDVAGTPIAEVYKVGACYEGGADYLLQVANDGDVTIEVIDDDYLCIERITVSNTQPTNTAKAKQTDGAADISWIQLLDDNGTVTFGDKADQKALNGPHSWTFALDDMLKRTGATMTTTAAGAAEATLTYHGGWGKATVTLTCYTQDRTYVAYRHAWTLTFGQAPKQTYPYTWDFTKFFTDTPSAMLNDKTWAAVDYSGTTNPLHVAIYNNNTTTNYGGTANGGWSNTYDMADYQSYYVEGAQLVCYGLRGTNNGVIRETAGLGFKLDTSGDGVPEENMLMLNMTNTVPEARAATNGQTWNTITAEGHQTESHLTIATGGKVIVPKPNDDTHYDDYYIYIKSSHEPTYNTSVKKMVSGETENGTQLTDANYDAPRGVYKYRFSANENAEFTFTSTDEAVDSKLQSYADPASPVGRKYTDIYAIAVTKDFKTMKKLSGTGWATESRDYAVDYTLNSLLTNRRPILAYSVIARSSNPLYTEEKTKTTVRLQDRNYVVPARQGLVLKQTEAVPGENNTTYTVPLFVPAVTTAVEPAYVYTNNLMRPNLTGAAPGTTNAAKTFDSETETINGVDYTRFILSEKYLTWKKDGETVTANDNFSQGAVPGFFRLHVFGNTSYDGRTDRNTLGPNKAYLLLRTDRINAPIWESGAPARQFVGIQGVSDFADDYEYNENTERVYNLRGQMVDDSSLQPGIYIRNGKKIIVK